MISLFVLGAATGGQTIDPAPWMMLPFALLLILIAVMPLTAADWWHHNYPLVSVILGSMTVAIYLLVFNASDRLLHVAVEYLSFIALLGSLFVVTGGIHITVKGESKPWINVLFLLTGAVVANIIGTTGASVLLIRPWIRMNKYRITAFHIVFFIFIVSNLGGCLTPIGDPPLFLGYLRGVPFFWVFEACWPAWLIAVGALLGIFYVLDRINFAQPPPEVTARLTASETWRFEGMSNLFWLAIILAAVLLNNQLPFLVPQLLMLGAGFASYYLTKRQIHESNHFNFAPIKEVAFLFAGIFATMVPALDYLQVHAREIGINTPMQLYWVTGMLSGLLDNAPTYLTFIATDLGLHKLNIESTKDVLHLVEEWPKELMAISLGAVFFGALTYIGNGPNFMVKSIAHQANAKSPSFFGYILFYAVPYLLPVLILVAALYFSPWAIF
jgi:Na+/H+ antiporter NhaD/arsenite permease-like protein